MSDFFKNDEELNRNITLFASTLNYLKLPKFLFSTFIRDDELYSNTEKQLLIDNGQTVVLKEYFDEY